MKNLIVVLIVIAVLIGGFLLLKNYNAPQTSTSTGISNPLAPNTVLISNFSFSPGTLTVKVGDTVTWINEDSVNHNIKSATFSSQNLATGDKYSFTFTQKGTYNYSCGIHPTMTGVVEVQ